MKTCRMLLVVVLSAKRKSTGRWIFGCLAPILEGLHTSRGASLPLTDRFDFRLTICRRS